MRFFRRNRASKKSALSRTKSLGRCRRVETLEARQLLAVIVWDDGDPDGAPDAGNDHDTDQQFVTGSNWRLNNAVPTTDPPNDIAPGALDQANIAYNSGTATGAAGVGGAAEINAGDAITVSGLRVGVNPGLGYGGHGRLEMNGGTLDVLGGGTGNAIRVGNPDRTGTFVINDGTVTTTNGFLVAADNANANGFVTIGDGVSSPVVNVSGGNFETAQSGTGEVTMNSGTLNVTTNNLIVGQGGNSNATFTMNGGLIDLHNQLRFNNGPGLFEQHGGTVNVGTILDIANGATNTDAIYRMHGGTLNVGDRVNSDLKIGNVNNVNASATMEVIDGIVNVSRSIRIADNGGNSSGMLIVGDGTTSPTINLNTGAGGNFETADNGTGTLMFKSGTINENNSNFITGQAGSSVANVTIGGFSSLAELKLMGTRDWNTNTGDGNVTVLANGVIDLGRNMNLGNDAAQGGLVLVIDGGTVNTGVDTGQGDVNFRNNGPRDEITFDGGTFSVGRNFNMNQGAGILNLVGEADGNFTIANNYSQNSVSTLNFETGATDLNRLQVTNNVNLGNGVLNVDFTNFTAPSAFTHGELVLIDNAGGNAVNGIFAGMPAGTSVFQFPDGNTEYVISYTGNTGNDVTLVPALVDADPVIFADADGPGTEQDIDVTIDGDGNVEVMITEKGNPGSATLVYEGPNALLNTITINGETGDDTLTIDFDGGDYVPAITFNGNGETNSPNGDTLALQGGGAFSDLTFNYVNENDGSVDISGNATITYTGLEPVSSTITAANVTLNYSGATETITIDDDGATATVDSNVGGEMTSFSTPTASLTVNGGGGADTFIVNDTFAPDTDINGEAGDDTLILNDAHGATFNFDGGSDGQETVTINDTNTTGQTRIDMQNGGGQAEMVTINDAHSGTLFVRTYAGNDTVLLVDANTVGLTTIQTDNNDDTVTVTNDHSGSLLIDTGNSNDTIMVTDATTTGSVTINSGNNNDMITVTDANSGSLLIDAGANNDTINLVNTHTTGDTEIRSRNGNDMITIDDAFSPQLIVDSNNNSGSIGHGNDTFILNDTHTSGLTFLDSTNGGSGNADTYTVNNANSGSLRLQGRGGSDTFTINDANTIGQTWIIGNDGAETVNIVDDHSGSLLIQTGNQNDTVIVTDVNTIGAVDIQTDAGNDTVTITDAHSDTLNLRAGDGVDTIQLIDTNTTGDTALNGDDGNDLITIDDANSPTLTVDSNGNNTGQTHGQGNDTITLNDTHTSGLTFLDSTNGGTGSNDTFIVNDANSGTLTVRGRGGDDTITFFDTNTTGLTQVFGDNANETVTIHAANSGSFLIQAGNNNDTIHVGGDVGSGSVANINVTIDVQGQGNNDSLNINDETNASATTYDVTDGDVTVGGNLVASYQSIENLTINGGSAGDTFDFDISGDPGLNQATLNGFDGEDVFNVNLSPNTAITVGGGDPAVPASPGDTLNMFTSDGMLDLPFVFFAGTDGSITDSPDMQIDWTSIESFTLDAEPFVVGDLYVETNDSSNRIIFTAPNGSDVQVRIDNVYFGPFPVPASNRIVTYAGGGNDFVVVHGIVPPIAEFHGGDGNDYIAGTTGSDFLYGDDGNDIVLAGRGDNFVHGDDPEDPTATGNDRIEGREGNDILLGGPGNDRITGRAGNDTLAGGTGNDQLFGGLGDDFSVGGLGIDLLRDESGNDILLGGADADQVFGDRDDDLVIGGTGADRIRGDFGDDVLINGSSALEAAIDTAIADLALLNDAAFTANVLPAITAWRSPARDDSLFGPYTDDTAVDDIFPGIGFDDIDAEVGTDIIRNFDGTEDTLI